MPHTYEWAVLRVVPRVERSEFVNAGVVVYCRALDFLAARVDLDLDRLAALDPSVDVAAVERHLESLRALCAGEAAAGANGARPPGERFRWLVAPRSTVVQASEVHAGLTDDPAAEVDRLLARMVLPPA